MTNKLFDWRSPGLLSIVLPWVSALGSYGLAALSAAATGDACGTIGLPGGGFGVQVATVIALIALPAIVVGYRAFVARRSWPLQLGLILATVMLTVIADWFALIMWAGGHQCFE